MMGANLKENLPASAFGAAAPTTSYDRCLGTSRRWAGSCSEPSGRRHSHQLLSRTGRPGQRAKGEECDGDKEINDKQMHTDCCNSRIGIPLSGWDRILGSCSYFRSHGDGTEMHFKI